MVKASQNFRQCMNNLNKFHPTIESLFNKIKTTVQRFYEGIEYLFGKVAHLGNYITNFSSCHLQLLLDSIKMQSNVDLEQLKALIDPYGISQEFWQFFSSWNIQKRYKYMNISETEIYQIGEKINSKRSKGVNNFSSKKTCLWIKGQFKLFIWVCAFYAFNFQISLSQLTKRDLQFLATIFLKKTVIRMKYELKSLDEAERCPRKRWNSQQVEILKSLLRRYQSNHMKPEWKTIAFELFSKTQGECFRTFSQCRQMWTNHLDTTISKDKWSYEQDELLLRLVAEENKKWSKICQKFKGTRSAHMIKNRYKALMKKEARKRYQPSETNQLEFGCPQNNIELNLAQDCQSKPSTESSIVQSQISHISQLKLQQEFSDQLSNQAEKTVCSKESKKLGFLFNYQQNFDLQKGKACQMNLIDYSSVQMSRFFMESNLLEQLGCSHYEQVELALQEEMGTSLQTEE